jgi:hypothetical protein
LRSRWRQRGAVLWPSLAMKLPVRSCSDGSCYQTGQHEAGGPDQQGSCHTGLIII